MHGIRFIDADIYMKTMQFVSYDILLVFRKHENLLVDVIFDRLEKSCRQSLFGRENEGIWGHEGLHEDHREAIVAKSFVLVRAAVVTGHVIRFGAKIQFFRDSKINCAVNML